VSSFASRLTSLATVFALSGFPAVLSACMALCVQGVPVVAMAHQDGASAGHAAHAPAPMPAAASDHSHHRSPAAPEPAAAAAESTTSPEAFDARLSATGTNCCPDGVAFAIGTGVARTNAQALVAAPMVVSVTLVLLTTAVLDAELHSPPVSPPAPSRAPLVLRI